MTETRRRLSRFLYSVVTASFIAIVPAQASADGFFSNIREDVRSTGSGDPPPPAPPREESRRDRKGHSGFGHEDGEHSLSEMLGLGAMFTMGTAWVVSPPFWGPAAVVGDTYDVGAYFADFPYAQSERAQFYSGVGFNWLDDPIDTDFGFNFTYGADFFPAKPWVISSSIDWGSLGRAEHFRFRTTAGLMCQGKLQSRGQSSICGWIRKNSAVCDERLNSCESSYPKSQSGSNPQPNLILQHARILSRDLKLRL